MTALAGKRLPTQYLIYRVVYAMPEDMEILGNGKEKSRIYLAVLSLAIIGFALVFSTWQIVQRQRQASLEHLELTSIAVLQAVESSLRRGPFSGMNRFTPNTREFFQDLENSGDVLFVGIIDDKGVRIGTEDAPAQPITFPAVALAALRAETRWQGEATYGDRAIYVALRPIPARNGPMHRREGRHGMREKDEHTQQPISPAASSTGRFLLVAVDMDKHFAVYNEFKRTAIFQTAYILAAAAFLWILAARFISRKNLAGKAVYLERFQARLIDSLPDSLLIIDAASGVIQAANPAAHSIFSKHGPKLLGRSTADIGLSANLSFSGGWHQTNLDGMHLEVRSLPFKNEDGTESFLVIARDRTDIRTLEKNLAEAEKLAAIGSLAAGVAHEIRNPLSALRGFAQYFAKKLAGKQPEEEYANTMVRESDRLNRVITDLLYLSRPRDLSPVPTDFPAIHKEISSLLHFELSDRNLAIIENFQTHTVNADPDGLKQVLLNLYLNAIEAMRENSGTVTIAAVPGTHQDKTGVWISVTDTGPGMAEEVRCRAFEPFHTTKEKGTGLGLALIHAIMRAHGGDATIWSPVSDDPHRPGCAVNLFFPDPHEPSIR